MAPRIERTAVVSVARLAPELREAMFALLETYYDKVTRDDFARDLITARAALLAALLFTLSRPAHGRQ